MKKQMVLYAILGLALVNCVGCMSPLAIGVRAERLGSSSASNHDFGLYPATRLDCQWLFHDYWTGGGWNLAADFWFLAPLTLIDIPLAIVTDTLALPCDIYYATRTNAVNQASQVIGAEAAPQPGR